MKKSLIATFVLAFILGAAYYQQVNTTVSKTISSEKTTSNILETPIPTVTVKPDSTKPFLPSTTPVISAEVSVFKDGVYHGGVYDAQWGYVQVTALISLGKITDIQIDQSPDSQGESIQINKIALPQLKQEAISAQSANVDAITGATDTSLAFIASLKSALKQA